MRIKLTYIFSSLLFLLAAGNLSATTDPITIGARTSDGENVIKFYDAKDTSSEIASITISEEYKEARFLAGRWISPSSTDSIMALHDHDNEREVIIFNDAGEVVNRFSLGKASKIVRVIAFDYNGDSKSDIAVQGKKKKVLIYLNPGLSNTTPLVLELKAPKYTDTIKIPGPPGSPDILASVKLAAAGSGHFKKKAKSYVSYANASGSVQKVKILKSPEQVLGFRTINNVPAVTTIKGKTIRFYGDSSIKSTKIKREKGQKVLAGSFLNEGISSVLIEQKDGVYNLESPGGVSSKSVVDITETAKAAAVEESDSYEEETEETGIDACQEYQSLVKKMEKMSSTNPMLMFIYIGQLQMLALECQGGGSSITEPEAIDTDNPAFSSGINLISSDAVSYGTNTGKNRGPCTKFFNPQDGTGGFLAKNSDHSGSVYLTEWGYSNAKILHPNSYKKIEDLEYTGIANGGRAHFRSPELLPRGEHIFAADSYSETHCWRIPDKMTRVD